MKNKGMTIIELIISLAMLSVSMVFMYSLMVNLQNKKNESDKFTDNVIMISEIENVIQEELVSEFSYGKNELTSVIISANTDTDPDNSKPEISFDLAKNSKVVNRKIIFTNEGVTIQNNEGKVIRKWVFLEKVSYIKANKKCSYEDPLFTLNYNVYLYSDTDKIIDVIHIPLGLTTTSFTGTC